MKGQFQLVLKTDTGKVLIQFDIHDGLFKITSNKESYDISKQMARSWLMQEIEEKVKIENKSVS